MTHLAECHRCVWVCFPLCQHDGPLLQAFNSSDSKQSNWFGLLRWSKQALNKSTKCFSVSFLERCEFKPYSGYREHLTTLSPLIWCESQRFTIMSILSSRIPLCIGLNSNILHWKRVEKSDATISRDPDLNNQRLHWKSLISSPRKLWTRIFSIAPKGTFCAHT